MELRGTRTLAAKMLGFWPGNQWRNLAAVLLGGRAAVIFPQSFERLVLSSPGKASAAPIMPAIEPPAYQPMRPSGDPWDRQGSSPFSKGGTR